MTLQANFFGKFEISHGETPLTRIRSEKSLELLAFLLAKRTRHSRESLASVIWGDYASSEQARKYLRNTLWQLQKKLNPVLEENGQLLLTDGRTVSINPDYPIWTDIEEFERTYNEVRDVGGDHLSSDQVKRLRYAVDLYKGAFLEGWFAEWCIVYRERSMHLALLMLDKLMENALESGEFESGILYGERILAYDRAREVTHRNLMKLFYLSGDRTSALRQYQLCEAILRDELEITPSERTRAVLESIRDDTFRNREDGDTTRT